MKCFKVICASIFAAILVGGVSGCATSNQSEDAKISGEVRALLDQRANLEAPSIIEVQTLNSTVYLNGLVSTDLDRRAAAEISHEVPGVVKVVNLIDLEN